MPDCAPRPTPTMIDIGVASPSAQGQAMISTDTAATSPKAKRGSGPNVHQAANATTATAMTRRHEPAGNLIGEALDRRAAALRLRDHLDDLRQHSIAADAIGAHDERAGLIDRAADDAVARRLDDWHRFAGHHRFVDRAAPVEDFAVDRHLVARPYAQSVADRDAFERDVLFAFVIAKPARCLGRKIEERPDRAAGPLAGAKLQHLPEQHEDSDARRGLVIGRRRAVHPAQRGRKKSGTTVAATLSIQAMPVPSAIRVNILTLRERSDRAPRSKNGQPAHRTTGVAKTNSAQFKICPPTASRRPVRCPLMSSATTGTASARPTQKRRVMLTSSGLGPATATGRSGSSAMPQIGQAPGPACRTSGCIGQV